MQQKQYYKRSTRPGSLKVLNMEGMVRKWGGGECLRRAVRGMLPKDRLREPRLGRLKGELVFFFLVLWGGEFFDLKVGEKGAHGNEGDDC